MAYKLKAHHRVTIGYVDRELACVDLPSYSKVVELLIRLEQNSSEREVLKTVANCKKMVDIHTEVAKALDAFKP